MSGDNGEIIGGDKKEDKLPNPLTIGFNEKGILNVEGPGDGKIFDEPMCFYMLEKGKDFIKRHNARVMMESQSKIIQANQGGGVMNFARNKR